MNLHDLKNWIKDNLITKKGYLHNGKCQINYFKLKNPEILIQLIKSTNFLDQNSRISERIYCMLNDLTVKYPCNNSNCNNSTRFINFQEGYKLYCSGSCSSKDPKIKQKIKESNIKKFGVENPMFLPEIKEKIKLTNLKKYGVEVGFHSKEIQEKIRLTNLKRYGRENISQINLNKKTLNKLNDFIWLKDNYIHNNKSSVQISLELNTTPKTVISYLKKYNIFDLKVDNSFSSYETEICNFIEHLNINIIKNSREIISPLELDIYIKDFNLAIEFNGLYWHSFNSTENENKDYHLNKTLSCKNKNIQLFHIFENEWLNKQKQDIWKSIIYNKLYKSNKIYARKCFIKELDNKTTKEFLNKNHLQGNCPSSIKLGLFYNNELISVMTFGKTRYSKKYQYELIRFCNKKFITVIGGASKLFKYFIKQYNPSSVISYCDLRYGVGKLYNNLGFTYSHQSQPNYYYYKPGLPILESRIKYQKHKLKNLLENFDNNLTESENMFNNGYRRIWDCGNLVYKWKTKY